jgi:hypothetical protein
MDWADRPAQIGCSETGLKWAWCSKHSVVTKWSQTLLNTFPLPDGLKLLAENIGETFTYSKNKLTCLICGYNSGLPPVASISICKSVAKSSEDDLAVGTRYPFKSVMLQQTIFLIFEMTE